MCSQEILSMRGIWEGGKYEDEGKEKTGNQDEEKVLG